MRYTNTGARIFATVLDEGGSSIAISNFFDLTHRLSVLQNHAVSINGSVSFFKIHSLTHSFS
jgi:hypothetical protein